LPGPMRVRGAGVRTQRAKLYGMYRVSSRTTCEKLGILPVKPFDSPQ
jgi:hypothetical protein